MKLRYLLILTGMLSAGFTSAASYATDTFKTKHNHELLITFIKHGSLMLTYKNQTIQVDPVSRFADYGNFPKADLILITHEHGDHLDASSIEKLTKTGTMLITNEASKKLLGKGVSLKNGEILKFSEQINIEAVPAYNTTAGREQFHPGKRDNGYVLTIDGLRVYIAGDTEDIPELKDLKKIDIAFIPVNQPYTMSISQAVHAAKMFLPKVLYPYHFGNTDIEKLKVELMGSDIEVRIRKLE